MNFNQRATTLLQLPIAPLTWDSILKECDRLEADFLHIPSAYKWSLDYKRFQVEHARGNHSMSVRYLKSAISTAPYNNEILGDYKELVKKTSGIKKLTLIIASKKNEVQALKLAAQFDQANIEYMIVSGSDAPSIGHVRALQVDASDRYESRPQKVAAAFTWAYENIGNNVGIMKVDDEMVLQDGEKLRQRLAQFIDENTYVGVPSASLSHDRCLHWGLCHDQDLNRRVYGRPVLRPWASGEAYYLGPQAVEKLVLSLLRFPGLFEGEYYEDKLVGDVLLFENTDLTEMKDVNEFGLSWPGAVEASPKQAAFSTQPTKHLDVTGSSLKITSIK
ncbi:hypothetical protein [Herbaspirillum lusitanum]|uniref:hypothetical protein n=1 Tax=Herbaspirillum lusitanum TaxID=213312 RepID=UPI0012F4B9F8|nr:hypothetical protein [Herbaspirillum lusitanum]